MTTVQQMSDLITYVGHLIHKICNDPNLTNIDEFSIDEWYGFESFDIHLENEEVRNQINVCAYPIKSGDNGYPETDYSNLIYQSFFDIKRTREAHTMSEQYIQPEQVDSSSGFALQRINEQTNQVFTQQQIEDMAFIISRHMRQDELFANRMQRLFSQSVNETIVEQVDVSTKWAMDKFKMELTREQIVAELMDVGTVSNSNFVRGMLDNGRFRTMIDTLVSSHVGTMLRDDNSWVMELIDDAVERKTRLMVNETVERSLKMIASRISAGSDV